MHPEVSWLDMTQLAWHGLAPWLRSSFETLVVVLLLMVSRLVILKLARRQCATNEMFYRWRKGTQYAVVFLGLGLVTPIWFSGTRDVATFLGLVSAGLALALKDPVMNLAGWAFIMVERPFSVGDRVEIDGLKGDVIDQRFFTFTLLEVGGWLMGEQSTGRLAHVPNARVFSHELYNYTEGFGFIWDELQIHITFESDWMLAKQLVRAVLDARAQALLPDAKAELERLSRQTLIHYTTLSPIVYLSVEGSGVCLSARYLAPVRQRRGERERVWEAILLTIAEHSARVELAYPTQRVHVTRPHPRDALASPPLSPGCGEG